jgi:hypothetical protein
VNEDMMPQMPTEMKMKVQGLKILADDSSEGAHAKETHNMGRQTRMEAFISFFTNAKRHTITEKLWKHTLFQRKTTC